ncbi:hypothetical protein DPMN_077607 [Dreissena polymorpha]|uniref:Uncharacterized protein n=1 Tax=Dreissena polymorpha TaxID=45954 RepID=A0A9D3YQZ0_DREPO|nr:hypothetical protein DPMN_077607 [Dreissena polymorpha]
MATDVALWVSRCGRCLRSKSPPIIATGLVNIESSYPMELLCIDYLSLEVSKGGNTGAQQRVFGIISVWSRKTEVADTLLRRKSLNRQEPQIGSEEGESPGI